MSLIDSVFERLTREQDLGASPRYARGRALLASVAENPGVADAPPGFRPSVTIPSRGTSGSTERVPLVDCPIALWPRLRPQLEKGAMLSSPPTSNIDWPAWTQAVGSVAAILVAIILARGEAMARKRERNAEIRAFYAPLEIILCEALMFLRGIREERDAQMALFSLRALMRREKGLRKYQQVPINLWAHLHVALQIDNIIEKMELIAEFMPDGRINIDTPYPGGGLGLIKEVDVEIGQTLSLIRAVRPRMPLLEYVKEKIKMFAMGREIDRLAKELEGEEIPSGRVRMDLVRAAISGEELES